MGYLPKLKRFVVDMEVTNAEKNKHRFRFFQFFRRAKDDKINRSLILLNSFL